MKRALTAILAACLCLAGLAAEGKEAVVLYRTEYQSPNGLDPGYYSFEAPFVSALPASRIALEVQEGASATIALRILCDPIVQLRVDGVPYKIFHATLRVSVSVIARDRAIRFAEELEPINGMGTDAKAAEINALAHARKALEAFAAARSGELAAALAE
jgi:hypothetical protein